ncbi:MAG: TRAP transporter TatT component family protein [Gammaproteobacteria bacterium]
MAVTRFTIFLLLSAILAGCSSLIRSATSGLADSLTTTILNQDDPELVRDGAPAFLLMMDSFVERDPDNEATLQGAAQLYAAYGAIFVEDPERAQRLAKRAQRYGERALCVKQRPPPKPKDRTSVVRKPYQKPEPQGDCDWRNLTYDEFVVALDALDEDDAPALYSFAVSWLAWISASKDFEAIANLPKVEAALMRLAEIDETTEPATVHKYLGVLNSLRTPALGGNPELGRQNFEDALSYADGRDLSIKVDYAQYYARLVYDRELHNRLLNEVLEADPVADGYTLFNTVAQRHARELLDSADDYF